VVRKTVLPNLFHIHRCSIGAKTQFATVYRPSRTSCSQPLSLHNRDDRVCRDGGAKGRYFESADRGAGLTHAPTFGACSSARLPLLRPELARSTSCMTRCVSHAWRGSTDTYACGCTHVTRFGGLQDNKTSRRTTRMTCLAACLTCRALRSSGGDIELLLACWSGRRLGVSLL
jgi:hypothetical protein